MLAVSDLAQDLVSRAPEPVARRFGELTGSLDSAPVAARSTWRRDAALLAWYLAAAEACGAVRRDAVLHVVDLCPGDGERAWQILRMLGDRVRYLAACLSLTAIMEPPMIGVMEPV
jgi:hypothetical protein